ELVEHPRLAQRIRALAEMLVEHAELAGVEAVEGTDRCDLAVGIDERHDGDLGAPRYLPLSNNYLTLASISSGLQHDDPAAQQRAGGAAELPEQPRLGAAGIGGIAAEPLIMVARDQEALVRPRSHEASCKRFETVAKTIICIGRTG